MLVGEQSAQVNTVIPIDDSFFLLDRTFLSSMIALTSSSVWSHVPPVLLVESSIHVQKDTTE